MIRPRRDEAANKPLEEYTKWQLMAIAYTGRLMNGPYKLVARFTPEQRSEAWRILRERKQ